MILVYKIDISMATLKINQNIINFKKDCTNRVWFWWFLDAETNV